MQGVRYRLLRRTLLPQIRVFRWVDPALEDVHKRASVAEEEGVVSGTHRDRVRITLFEGEVFQIAGENLSQSIDGGDATSLVSTNDLRVITPLDRGRIRWRSIVLTSSDLCVRQHWQAR